MDLVITILASFIIGLLVIWQALSLSNVINRVFLLGEDLGKVSSVLWTLFVVIIFRAGLSWVSEFSASRASIRIRQELRERLFHHIYELGPSFTKSERTGELTSVVTESVEALDPYFSQYLPQLVISALLPLTVLIVVFPIDPLSGFILLVTAPLIPLFMYLIGKAAESLTHRQYDTLRRLSAHFLDSLQGLTTLKQFGRSQAHIRNIELASDRFRDATLNVLRVTFLSAFVLEMVATISTAVIAVEVGLRLLYGRMAFEQALFLLVLAPEFYVPLRMLGLRFHAGMSGTAAAGRIFGILDTPPQSRTPVSGESTLSTIDSVRFANVQFVFPGESTPSLEDINFTIFTGQNIAIVGPSGAGKTTLMSLLLRFNNPTMGQIFVNEVDLASCSEDAWREKIAWVPQNPHLFFDTIEANIRLANPAASDEQIQNAAKAANLHEFIQTLPEGYQTIVGESGARLSGGQAQRVAIARAFLKDAPLLILDEPTSSLDPEQEWLLNDSLKKLTKQRTVISIAHRLNTVIAADQILVIDKGRIVESGTHDDLLRKNGKYLELISPVTESGLGTTVVDDTDSVQRKEAQLPENKYEEPPPKKPFTKSSGTIFLRLLGFLKGSWTWVSLSVLLGIATIGANIGLMGTSAYLLSAAALHPSIAELQVAIVGVRFFGISRGVFRYLERLASHTVTFQMLSKLRVWFYGVIEPLSPARLMSYGSGDLLTRIVDDINVLENFYVRVVSPPLVAVIVSVGMSLYLAAFDPSLGWVLMGFLLLLGVIVPTVIQTFSRKPGRDWVQQRAEIQTRLVEDIQGMADVMAFGRQVSKESHLRESGLRFGIAQKRLAVISSTNSGLSVLLSNLGMWLILVLAIPLVAAGQLPGVMLATLTLAALASFEAVTPLPFAAQTLGSSLEAAKRLFEVVDVQPAVVDIPESEARPGSYEGIEFSHVSFNYETQGVNALTGVDFSLPHGKSLAIVGPSGAGKSSILQLLQRFWEFDEGEIFINGKSIRTYNQVGVRKLFAVVSQNSFFFNATVRQNLLLANPTATQEQMGAATEKAQIHDFIAALPAGYETWIGETGTRLSGGERQRLAIARALLKDAPILLLDEPTANLDPKTERAVLETIWGITRVRTTLMITHRLIGLDHFDEVLVLDRGRVVERGTHSSLLRLNGLYKRMWSLQSRWILA